MIEFRDKILKELRLNEVMRVGTNPVLLVFLPEEEIRHIQKRSEDKGKRQPCVRKEDRPQEKSTLLTPLFRLPASRIVIK